MSPPPESPVFVIFSVCLLTKCAVIDVSAVMYTVHVWLEPPQAPDHSTMCSSVSVAVS
jgi:hypothetical protein